MGLTPRLKTPFALAAPVACSVIMLAALAGPVSAANATDTSTAGPPVGSWRVTVSVAGGPSQTSLATFGADGTLIVSDAPVSSDQSGVAYVSAGHGVWQTTDSNAFAFTFDELESDAQGNPSATLTIDATGAVDASAGTISGQFVFTVQGPDGTTYAHVPGTFTGTAMTVEPMPSPDASMAPAG